MVPVRVGAGSKQSGSGGSGSAQELIAIGDYAGTLGSLNLYRLNTHYECSKTFKTRKKIAKS